MAACTLGVGTGWGRFKMAASTYGVGTDPRRMKRRSAKAYRLHDPFAKFTL